jgi:hypothetical protein
MNNVSEDDKDGELLSDVSSDSDDPGEINHIKRASTKKIYLNDNEDEFKRKNSNLMNFNIVEYSPKNRFARVSLFL